MYVNFISGCLLAYPKRRPMLIKFMNAVTKYEAFIFFYIILSSLSNLVNENNGYTVDRGLQLTF